MPVSQDHRDEEKHGGYEERKYSEGPLQRGFFRSLLPIDSGAETGQRGSGQVARVKFLFSYFKGIRRVVVRVPVQNIVEFLVCFTRHRPHQVID